MAFGKKNLSRLIPVKKSVIDTRINKNVERTYYIDPNKHKSGERSPIEKIKNFNDFKSIDVDPKAAKQFFCNL